MDYKKILAATAVTSAAIVVPVVAQAEETTEIEVTTNGELISETNSVFGKTIKANTKIDDVDYKYTAYEWYIEGVKVSTGTEYKVPISAVDKTVKLIVTYVDGEITKKMSDTVTIDSLGKAEAKFNDEDGKPVETATINSSITAKGYKVDTGEVVTGFQWYIVDTNTYNFELLSGETDVELDVPFKAQGKQLLFVVSTKQGNYYTSVIDVEEIVVEENDTKFELALNGTTTSNIDEVELVAGDVVSVKNITVDGGNNVKLTASQFDVKYQWYAITKEDNKVNSTILVKDATNASFTVPADSAKKEYGQFMVEIYISVPQIEFDFMYPVFVGNKLAVSEILETYITNLVDSSSKAYQLDIKAPDYTDDMTLTGFMRFKSYVSFLNSEYEKLSPNRKQLISNYALLQEANQDVQAFTKFYDEYKKFVDLKMNFENKTVKHADLTKKFATLKTAYNKLTAKQRSLMPLAGIETNYVDIMQEWLNKSATSYDSKDYITYKIIDDLNKEIVGLLILNTTSEDNTTYGNAYLIAREYDMFPFESIVEFQSKVKTLTEEAAKVDKTFQPLIYTSVLKTAQTNAKKAQAVVDKINLIENAKDSKKKASAIIAANKLYDKLTALQKSLILNIKALTPEETDAQDEASEVVEELRDLISGLKDYTESTEDLTLTIEEITTQYKLLSPADKKQVTNYSTVAQVKKDVKAADKVVKAFAAAEKLEDDANTIDSDNVKGIISKLKSAKTKYQAAYKAYIKLTPTVRILVDSSISEKDLIESFDIIIKGIDTEIDKLSEVTVTDSKASTLIDEITKFEAEVTKGSTDTTVALTTLNSLKTQYKALSSVDKKKVYNYSTLSTINANISKAKTAETKLQAALKDGSESKLTTALTAFKKLTEIQQGLVSKSILDDVNTALEDIQDGKTDKSDLEFMFETLAGEYGYEDVKSAQKEANRLSAKELKAIKNYNAYQNALKELKAVESFIAKIDKLGDTPTYSKKQTIITNYNKLTAKQAMIFESMDGYPQIISEMIKKLTTSSKNLNEFIGSLLVSGQYDLKASFNEVPEVKGEALSFVTSFDEFLAAIDSEYKKLDSKEKKLVPHYSIVTQAKKDSKAIKSVIELAVKYNASSVDSKGSDELKVQWERAFNKLSAQQQSLFNLAMPGFKK
ncbi:hypothetical protein DCE79_10310 [Lysinibacillus sp. 2017]|uniref:hypothetical protein n=1 Tax=unclassified Lysinibacillus TaxID=2636778 RepID=UPI000D52992D|nr:MULTISPECIES: hypothetical protein [unclassified Lysinibacillus]AWE07752.1 hypothetical protein DCE79_10310 [Lysinibacillus sp. 2017]TGN32322.1 hypothetical protein E4L99_15460 [Lysinibacillus sp. S2017]